MALTTCNECGASISTAAASCPQCGASKKAMGAGQPISTFGWIWRGVLGLFALLVVMTAWNGRTSSITQPSENAAPTPTESEQDDQRMKRAIVDAVSLKQSLRDPDSIQFERINATRTGDVVCIRYRARNGFGGMNREAAVFTDAAGSTSAKLWRAFCRHGKFIDVTDLVSANLKALGR